MRSTTPIPAKGCAGTLKSSNHANPRKGLRGKPKSCNSKPRVRALDHANPREGLHVMPTSSKKYSNFTSHSCTRPHDPRKGLRGNPIYKGSNLSHAFLRSTTPVAAKGCAGTLQVATLSRVRALDHANPRKGLRGNPIKVATLPRVRALDHADPRKGLHSRSMTSAPPRP